MQIHSRCAHTCMHAHTPTHLVTALSTTDACLVFLRKACGSNLTKNSHGKCSQALTVIKYNLDRRNGQFCTKILFWRTSNKGVSDNKVLMQFIASFDTSTKARHSTRTKALHFHCIEGSQFSWFTFCFYLAHVLSNNAMNVLEFWIGVYYTIFFLNTVFRQYELDLASAVALPETRPETLLRKHFLVNCFLIPFP